MLNARVRIIGGRDQGGAEASLSYIDSTANKWNAASVGVSISQERRTDLEVHIPMTDVSLVQSYCSHS